jgi:hypothetical protein
MSPACWACKKSSFDFPALMAISRNRKLVGDTGSDPGKYRRED